VTLGGNRWRHRAKRVNEVLSDKQYPALNPAKPQAFENAKDRRLCFARRRLEDFQLTGKNRDVSVNDENVLRGQTGGASQSSLPVPPCRSGWGLQRSLPLHFGPRRVAGFAALLPAVHIFERVP